MIGALGAAAALASAVPVPAPLRSAETILGPGEILVAGERAERDGDRAAARLAYEILTSNRTKAVRNEARFRLARLMIGEHRPAKAALLLRAILDEEPGAQRVRLELASLLAKMGDETSALRQFRAASANGLPPDVRQLVARYATSLRSSRRLGGSLRLGFASDSNANRATGSDTIGTVVGDFTMGDDGRPVAARGITTQAEIYGRAHLSGDLSLAAAVSQNGTIHAKRGLDDQAIGVTFGPELTVGGIRLGTHFGASRRWYGGERLTDTADVKVDATTLVAGRLQATAAIATGRVRNFRNGMESGRTYSGSVGLEASLSPTTGAGASISAGRFQLRDRAYSGTTAQLSAFVYREAGGVTVTATATAARYRADGPIALFARRRNDLNYRATFGVVVRKLQVAGFAPTATLVREGNASPVELYRFRRTVLDIGISRAF